MSEPYTPLMAELREAYQLSDDGLDFKSAFARRGAEFDRALAAHDESVRAEARAEGEATRAAVLDWASRFIPGDRWDTEDLSDLEAALSGIVEAHPTAHWRREQASLMAERDELAAVIEKVRELLRGDVWAKKCPLCGANPGQPCYGNGPMPRDMTHHGRSWTTKDVAGILPAAPADLLSERDARMRAEGAKQALLDAAEALADENGDQYREVGKLARDSAGGLIGIVHAAEAWLRTRAERLPAPHDTEAKP